MKPSQNKAKWGGNRAISSFCLSKHHHPSKGEAAYCNRLLADLQAGKIRFYKCQPSLPLIINGKTWLSWAVDFMVEELDGKISFHESKGWNRSDEGFRLKLRAALILYPNTKFYVNGRLATASDCGRLKYLDIDELKELRSKK